MTATQEPGNGEETQQQEEQLREQDEEARTEEARKRLEEARQKSEDEREQQGKQVPRPPQAPAPHDQTAEPTPPPEGTTP
jgi:hypothetical protein